jgi:hypothetical protein
MTMSLSGGFLLPQLGIVDIGPPGTAGMRKVADFVLTNKKTVLCKGLVPDSSEERLIQDW